MQGYRLQNGQYEPIEPIDGRLPSDVLACTWNEMDGPCGCSIQRRAND